MGFNDNNLLYNLNNGFVNGMPVSHRPVDTSKVHVETPGERAVAARLQRREMGEQAYSEMKAKEDTERVNKEIEATSHTPVGDFLMGVQSGARDLGHRFFDTFGQGINSIAWGADQLAGFIPGKQGRTDFQDLLKLTGQTLDPTRYYSWAVSDKHAHPWSDENHGAEDVMTPSQADGINLGFGLVGTLFGGKIGSNLMKPSNAHLRGFDASTAKGSLKYGKSALRTTSEGESPAVKVDGTEKASLRDWTDSDLPDDWANPTSTVKDDPTFSRLMDEDNARKSQTNATSATNRDIVALDPEGWENIEALPRKFKTTVDGKSVISNGIYQGLYDVKEFMNTPMWQNLYKKFHEKYPQWSEAYIRKGVNDISDNARIFKANHPKNYRGASKALNFGDTQDVSRIFIDPQQGDLVGTIRHEGEHSFFNSRMFDEEFSNHVNAYNNDLINYALNKYGDRTRILTLKITKPKDYNKLISPQELQSNIRPLQIRMQKQGWSPLLAVKHLDPEYSSLNDLIKLYGKDGVAYLLENVFKRGGKLIKRNINS